jgi:hypothetical protein
MAYSRANLQRIGPQNSNAPALYTFADTASTKAQIDASGYFNDAADMLQVGDFILVVGSDGYGVAVVVSNTRDLTASPPVSGVVDTSNATAVGTIDSD